MICADLRIIMDSVGRFNDSSFYKARFLQQALMTGLGNTLGAHLMSLG